MMQFISSHSCVGQIPFLHVLSGLTEGTVIFDLLFRVYFISFTHGQEINGRKKMEKII